jgi:hypothetical protein
MSEQASVTAPATEAQQEDQVTSFLREYDALCAEVTAYLESLAEADLDAPSGNPKWQRRVVAAHLAASPAAFARFTGFPAKGRSLPIPLKVADVLNIISSRRNRKTPLATIRADYAAGSAQLKEAIESTRGSDWGKRLNLFGTRRTLEGWFRDVAFHHEREHLAQLKGG